MALKIDTNRSATAFHINGRCGGYLPTRSTRSLPSRIIRWSGATSRGQPEAAAARHAKSLDWLAAAALSPEDQAALDAHNMTASPISAASLKAYQDKKSKEQAEADQAAQGRIDHCFRSAAAPIRMRAAR